MVQEDIDFELVPELKLDHRLLDRRNDDGALKVPKRSASMSVASPSLPFGRRPSAPSGPSSPAGAFLSRINSKLTGLSESPPDFGVGVYKWGKVLGTGGSSLVREAFAEGGRVCAVKIISKNTVSEEDIAHELAVWSNLHHPNILELLDHYETTKSVYLITECMTLGSLHDYLKKTRAFNPKPLAIYARYLRDLASALKYLHCEQEVVHRDVKLENCLIHPERGVLLCDFGLAEPIGENIMKLQLDHLIGPGPTSTFLYSLPPSRRASVVGSQPAMGSATISPSSIGREQAVFSVGNSRRASISNSQPGSQIGSVTSLASFGTLSRQSSLSHVSSRLGGSLPYAAPELLDESLLPDEISAAVDIWAFGVCTYTLFASQLPWSYPFSPRLRSMILTTNYDVSPLEEVVRPLVASCLKRDYTARPGIEELYDRVENLVDFFEDEIKSEFKPSYDLRGIETPRSSMDAGSEVLQTPFLNVT